MIGIVIVSHSKKLALGVQELAHQMVQGAVNAPQLVIAAGIDDPEHPLGTDVIQIYQAIESVYSEQGVVVLMDLGSAILSAEMALEFLSEEQRLKVRLCEAPIVEGTIAAAVQASTGADLEQVLTEARAAITAKAAQLSMVGTQHSVPPISRIIASEKQTPELVFTIQNQMGLHARPAAKLVAIAAQFQSDITLRNMTTQSQAVNAKSINQVVTSGIRQGHKITIAATGNDATQALAALQQLINTNFQEQAVEPIAALIPHPHVLGQLSGQPASPGIAIAKIVIYSPAVQNAMQPYADNPQEEWQQLQTACATAHDQIQMLRHKTLIEVGTAEAAIFDAHLLYLADPVVREKTRQLIFDQCFTAATAWQTVIDETVASYEALTDSYLQARAIDVADVGQRVWQLLTGTAPTSWNVAEPAILVANDLTPSQTAQLDLSKVLGICTVKGGATSHTGILARSLGIPTVIGLGAELLHLEDGTLIALDGETGQVWVQPDEAQLRALEAKRNSQQAVVQASRVTTQQPAITQDQHQIKVMANICGIADAKLAMDAGATGVGLLRSEFLYLERAIAPTEQEQIQVYNAIAATVAPHPLIIRALDIGGDKPLPYLNLPTEANPFLGWRGIRLLLDCPDLFKTQLRAILQVSHQHLIKIMFPMVASVAEICAAKEILHTAQAELHSEGIPFDQAMEVGVMVEVPAAVAMADQLAAEVDFFSIGTNDLSQYVMAADRTNPKVANLADAFEPAVLRMIQQTVKAANYAEIWVGVCGELASSPLAAPILLGLGVNELSMNPIAIAAVKATISQLTISEAEAIAFTALQLNSAHQVKEYIAEQLKDKI